MSRMKTFFKYFLIVVLFYVFSNIMINAFLKVSYKDLHGYQINVDNAFVDVTEAKASKRNGYINGIIKNNTDKTIENKYLKVSMLSKNNNVLGEKYIKIDKLEPEQLRKFEVKFDYDNVKNFKIEMTDTKPEEVDFIELVKTNAKDLVSNSFNK
ncbi:MAG: FxLYD domain-containing protein [Clostridia bacterium]|nr:FxLYD domain-containing protein [Clostridia bacterium]